MLNYRYQRKGAGRGSQGRSRKGVIFTKLIALLLIFLFAFPANIAFGQENVQGNLGNFSGGTGGLGETGEGGQTGGAGGTGSAGATETIIQNRTKGGVPQQIESPKSVPTPQNESTPLTPATPRRKVEGATRTNDPTPAPVPDESSDVEPIEPADEEDLLDHYRNKIDIAKFSQVDESSGTFNFQLPLAIPPGRNGMQPNLALQYSSKSSAGGSVVGHGWSLSIPYIERMNKLGVENMYEDMYFASSLSGELATTTGSTTLYQAKTETGDFLKYQFSDNLKWTATDKNGTVYTFGAYAGSRQDDPEDSSRIYKWLLNEIRDTNGNFVEYEYYKDSDSGQIYPYKIHYTEHATFDGRFEIEFSRTASSDYATSTASGFQIETRSRISEITAKINGNWVRKYELAYTTPLHRSKSLLESVTETGKDESDVETTLQPYVFEYTDSDTPGWVEDEEWVLPEPFIENSGKSAATYFAEVNGDGLPDIIRARHVTTPSDDMVRVYLNDESQWVYNSALSDSLYTTLDGERFMDTGVDMGFRVLDVNGDGLDDILQFKSGVQRMALINTGNGWVDDSTWYAPIAFVDSVGKDNGVRTADVNGDGLVDFMHNSTGGTDATYINNGRGWDISTTLWILPVDFIDGSNRDNGFVPVDMNGDGLTDFIRSYQEGQSVQIAQYVNDGQGGWISQNTLPGLGSPDVFIQNFRDFAFRTTDVNGDNETDIMQYLDESGSATKKSYIDIGASWQNLTDDWNNPRLFVQRTDWKSAGTQLVDFTGDGMVDVIQRDQSGNTHAYTNTSDKVDFLKTITYPTGGETAVEYKAQQQYRNSGDHLINKVPFSLFTVSKITNDDGLGNLVEAEYTYQDGHFYFSTPYDRKFAGFGQVTRTAETGDMVKTYFHQASSTLSALGEYDDHISKAGKPFRTEVLDDNGNKYAVGINKWEKQSLGSTSHFVKLTQSVDLSYDGDSDHRDKAESYAYDAYGNLTQKIEWGEVTGSTDGTFTDTGSDKLTTNIAFASSASRYVFAPYSASTTDQSSNKVRESKNYYDTLSLGSVDKGNQTKQEQWKSSSSYVDTEKTYNSYGLVTEEKDPRDKVTTIVYDPYHIYPATTTNALSQKTEAIYDYTAGKPKEVKDANGHIFQTVYDGLDRVTEEKQPDLTASTTLVTKATYSYTDTGSLPRAVQKTSYLNAATSTDAYVYVDGFGRTVQERVEAEDSNTFAVKDTKYNSVGLVEKESLPYFGVGAADTDATATSTLYINYQYDPLHRVTSIENAVGETTNTYEDWKIITTDPNGEIKRLSKDAYGNLVEVEEINGASAYTTEYEYDGNKNLTKITDALGNIRNFTYDALGRQLTAEDLHASGDSYFGTWTYTYDDSGNRLSQVDPKSQTVNFTYDDLNRVLTENYTGAAGTEITYGYDSCFGGKGMLCTVTNFYANFAYEYFPMGLVKKETKTISSVAYPTSYTYDRLGNIATITHPDDAVIGYVYNTAGQPEKVWWKEDYASASTTVVTDLDYAPTGQISFQKDANGVETTNTYDATKVYRLTNKYTASLATTTTTARFYAGAGDGSVSYAGGSTWATAQGTSSGTSVSTTSSTLTMGSSLEDPVLSNHYSITRGFYPFDTSGIPSNATINSATLNVHVDSGVFLNGDNDGDDFISVLQTSQASSTNLTTADYDNVGTTEGSSRADFGTLTTGAYNTLALNSTGRGWIKKSGATSNCGTTTGWTCLGTREGHDLINSSIDTNLNNTTRSASSEASGTSTDPYLEVTYEIPLATTVFQNIFYTYDPVGNITTLAESATTSAYRNVAYQYDDLHRLTRASSTLAASNYLETYSYNALGNITNKSDQGSYTYAGNTGSNYANPHAATAIGAASLTYDNNGNLLTFGPQTNSWDYRNRLSQTGTGTATSTATYDFQNQRVKYTNNSGTTTTYVSKFYDIKDSVVKKHVYIGDNLALTIQATPNEVSNSVTPPDEGESLASGGIGGSIYNYTLHYVHGDHLSGSNVVTDDEGALEETMDYLPFGKVRIDDSVTGYSQGQKFTGHDYDEESELSYMGARYQNGKTGTFLSQDPAFLSVGTSDLKQKTNLELQQYLSDPQGLNGYSYSRNNPIKSVDPNGEWFKEVATGKQSPSDFQVEVGQAANQLSQDSQKWNAAISHPYETGAKVGVGSGVLALGGVVATEQALVGVNLARLSSLPMLSRVDTIANKGFDAIQKATGLTKSEAIKIIQATGESLVDLRNSGNINNVVEMGNKAIRITTNPNATKIISAGVMETQKLANHISTGAMRAVPTITNLIKNLSK